MSIVIEKVESLLGERHSTVARDLKLNFRKLLEDSALLPEEGLLATIALAKTTGFHELLATAREAALISGLTEGLIQEAQDSAAIMGMLNVYYRTRHFLEHHDPAAKDAYGAAKLRMTSLANPVMGKQKFEMLAYAVSCVNGCEMCVTSHEMALMHTGVEREKIHDLTRLAAVVFGISKLL